MEPYRTYRVQRAKQAPLIRFILDALEKSGCRILHEPSPSTAPFRITFETPQGERLGIVAYGFLASNRKIKDRPPDEHRFQISYDGDRNGLHPFWQDPYGLYVTLLIGIDPERGVFVAADPILHNPTRFPTSIEFEEAHVEEILRQNWFAWEREPEEHGPRPTKSYAERAADVHQPLFEALVGGTPGSLLRLVRFEREVLGEAPGERHYVAEHYERRVSSLLTATSAKSQSRISR